MTVSKEIRAVVAGRNLRSSRSQGDQCALRSAALAVLALLGLAGALAGAAGDDPPAAPPAGDTPGRRVQGLPGVPLEFDSELIRLFIVADSLEVDGIYRFLCHARGTQEMTLFYPYPQDSLLGGARMLRLEVRAAHGAWQPARFEEIPRAPGGRWWVPLNLGDSLEVRCVYRQALHTTYARYIVTTTRHWQRPLSHARFEIYLPPGATPTRFSFPFRVEQADGVQCYAYEAKSFMPAEDIIVEWTMDARDPRAPGSPLRAPGAPETSLPRDR